MSQEGKRHSTAPFLSSPLPSFLVYWAVTGKILTKQNAALRRVSHLDTDILFVVCFETGTQVTQVNPT